MSNHHVIILVLFSLLAVFSAASAVGGRGGGGVLGGYKPIKNLSDPYVVDVAKFAIEEHNKEEKDHLKVVKVVKGESQVVSGTNYRLTIVASDSKQYEAAVYDQPWTHVRKLVEFRAV